MRTQLNPRSDAERRYWGQFLGCPDCGMVAGEPCRDLRRPWTDTITSMPHKNRPRKRRRPKRNGRKHPI